MSDTERGCDPSPLPPPAPSTTPAEAEPPAPVDDDRSLLSQPNRQSPLAFVFIAWRFVRRLGLSAIVASLVFVFNGGLALSALTVAIGLAIVLLVSSALSWWRFTFAVIGDDLVVTKGVVSVERLVIPLERVQSVDIDERLFHRPFGLVRATVDTAGSSTTEFEIDAIDRRRAQALRQVAATNRRGPVPDGASTMPSDRTSPERPTEVVLIQRSFGELVRVGLTKLPLAGLAVLAPIIAFSDDIGALAGTGDQIERGLEQLADTGTASVGGAIALAAWLLGTVLVVGALLQVVGELATNWKLTLFQTPTGLRRTAGLLTTTSRSIMTKRVQIVTTDDSWPQRKLGFTKVTLRAFGDTDIDLPGATPSEVELLRGIVGSTTDAPPLDRTISGWSAFVAIRHRAIVTLAAAAALWFVVGAWALLTLLVIPASVPTMILQWRRRRWGIEPTMLAERYGIVWQHTGELSLHKAQVVTVRQSFFARRRGLATLEVATAGGAIAIPFIGVDEACAARDMIVHSAETDRRRVF